jgi:hypothetical protein
LLMSAWEWRIASPEVAEFRLFVRADAGLIL